MSDLLTIETPRLLLREWRDEDLEPFSRMNADERVWEFLGKALTPEETRAMVERNRADFQEQGFGLWALEVKGGPAFIGYTGLGIPSFRRTSLLVWRLVGGSHLSIGERDTQLKQQKPSSTMLSRG